MILLRISVRRWKTKEVEAMNKRKGLFRVIFGRTTFALVALIIQISILVSCFLFLKHHEIYIYGGFVLLSAVVVIYIMNKPENPSFKLAWIIPILVIPVFGTLFYLFVEFQIGGKVIQKRLSNGILRTRPYLEQNPGVMGRLERESRAEANLAEYMNQFGGYPVYDKTNVKYFPIGEKMFEEMKKQLEQAEDFIFLEYFIVERGVMWDAILEILERKVKEGVEVRFLYDGMCSLVLLPHNYPQEMEAKGIKCKMFSPIKPALSTYQNNRDHRKILVIDGHTAFTGGINLADEYINQKVRFGHWKDTGIMVKGDAVKSFTMMFLQMWGITEKEPEDYSRFLRKEEYFYPPELEMEGYVLPYGDSPLDHENVAERVYMDIIYQAKRYVHIMTPYLILDNEMVTALTYAAKRGVETVIIMPHIPDKLYAYLLARSYYEELLNSGVSIYEYTPGFVHAKVFTSDHEKAVVGTVNLDYRSLYLHFECAAYLYRNPAVREVEYDFQETLMNCQPVTIEECRSYPFYKKMTGRILRLFAPLM